MYSQINGEEEVEIQIQIWEDGRRMSLSGYVNQAKKKPLLSWASQSRRWDGMGRRKCLKGEFCQSGIWKLVLES